MTEETPKQETLGDEEEPGVKVKDRRLLSEDERRGEAKGTDTPGEETTDPETEAADGTAEQQADSPHDQAEAAAEQDAHGDREADGDQEADGDREDLPDPTVDDVLAMAISMLVGHAWQKIGLQASPRTGLVVKDLEEARIAIDSLEGLIEQLAKRIPAKEAGELQAMLANLRVNFVQQSGSS